MNTAMRLAKNSVALLTASLVDRVLNVLFIAVLVRHISLEDFGAYTVVITFFEFGSLFADFGMSQFLIRDIAQKRDRASVIWSNALVLGGLWSIVGWMALGTVGTVVGYPTSVLPLLWLVGAALLFKVVWAFSGAVLQAFERMEIMAAIHSGYSSLFALVGIVCLWLGWGVPAIIWTLVLMTALIGLVTFIVVHRWFVPFRFKVDPAIWAQMVREVWPIAVLLGCSILLRRAGILLLSLVSTMGATANYAAAVKIVDLLGLLTTSLTGALLPHLASRWGVSVQAGWRAYRYSLRFFIVLSTGLTVGTLVLARSLVLLFLGPMYVESVLPLQVLLLSFFLDFVGGPMGALLLVSRDQLVAFVPRALVVTIVNIGLSLWLLPQYGYLAASCIAVLSSAGLLLFKIAMIQRLTDQRVPWRSLLARPLVAVLGMAVVLYVVRDGSPLWTVPLGALSYGLLLVLLGEFRQPDYAVLRESWGVLWKRRLSR